MVDHADSSDEIFVEGRNPLASESTETWSRLIDATGPATMLVAIRSRMGTALEARITPEDIWQETLLNAWRDRASFEWHGLRAFRRWLLRVAENRIRDAVDRLGAARRGSGREVSLQGLRTSGSESGELSEVLAAMVTTSPSRLVVVREQALRMQSALDSIPNDLREILRLRLFEDVPIEEIAVRCGLGIDAAKYRLRKGAVVYRRILESGSSLLP